MENQKNIGNNKKGYFEPGINANMNLNNAKMHKDKH
jgi:hypothetical protein